MKKLILAVSFIASLILITFPINVHSVESRSAILANSCVGCHGVDGKSVGSIPSLHGIKFNDFVSTMKAFRSDERKGTVMNRIARGYTDKEIEAMAKYFAEIK